MIKKYLKKVGSQNSGSLPNRNYFSEDKYIFGEYLITVSGNYSLSSEVYFGHVGLYKKRNNHYYQDDCEEMISAQSEDIALDKCCEYLENKLGRHAIMDRILEMNNG